MRNLIRYLSALALVALPGALSGQTSQCLPSDSTSAWMVEGLRSLMTTTVAEVIAERQAMHLAVVPVDSIAVVSDSTTCSAMSSAVRGSISLTPSDSARVYVVRVGTLYVVRDPMLVSGEWVIQMVINAQGIVLAKYRT